MVRISQDRGGDDSCDGQWDYATSPELTGLGLARQIDARPGGLWLVGNEPERREVQDDICPRDYARAYHDVYHFIKSRDPSARVSAGGLVLVSPMRLAYLDIVWDAYLEFYGETMPVDVWAAHLYVLSETGSGDAHQALGVDPDLGQLYSGNCADPDTLCHAEHDDLDLVFDQILQMRRWMKARGHQDRPLIITEYGIIKPYHMGPGATCALETCTETGDGCFCDELGETFHPRRVGQFLVDTFDMMRAASDDDLGYPPDDHRLVQQWLWFKLATDEPHYIGHPANIVDPDVVGPDGEWVLTDVGQRWREYARQIAPQTNIFAVNVPTVRGTVLEGTCSAAVTLSAYLMNNGNTAPDGVQYATFYADQGLSQPIAVVPFDAPRGCAMETRVVTTTWSSLCVGEHPFWVDLDGTAAQGEEASVAEVATGLVVITAIHSVHAYLPAVLR
jgi:hypothetical protein